MRHLKTTILLITTAFLIGAVGCKKDTTADVVVTETVTNTPAVGIPVNFGYSTSGVFSGQVVEQTKTTDATGKVSFKGEDKSKSYSVGFPNGAAYFGDGTSLQKGTHNRVFLHASPFAYVRVHAKNVNPFDNNDWINITNGLLGGGGLLYGINVDTTVVKGPFKGTENGGFGWTVNKNNTITTFTTTLYFIGKDTINYSINY